MTLDRGKGGQLKILSQEQVYEIHLATLEVLDCTGVRVDHSSVLRIMGDNGCKIDLDKKIVKIPEYVLKKALETCPSRITIYGKDSKFDVVLDDTNTVHTLGGAGSYLRLQRMNRLLYEALKEGEITVEQAIELLKDHTNCPDSICRHTTPGRIPIKTYASVVFSSREKTEMYCARGNPCQNEFKRYIFNGSQEG